MDAIFRSKTLYHKTAKTTRMHLPSGDAFPFPKEKIFKIKETRICKMRPCTDRRRRSGAQTSGTDVKRSRTGRRSVRVPRRIPRKGEFGLVLPRTFVFCVIPSHPTIFKPSQLHIHFLSPVFVLKSMNTFLFPHFFNLFLKDLYKYLCKM